MKAATDKCVFALELSPLVYERHHSCLATNSLLPPVSCHLLQNERHNRQDRSSAADGRRDRRSWCVHAIERLVGPCVSTHACCGYYRPLSLHLALAITDELGRNRDKIKATHSKVKSVNDMARRGGNIVSRMSARDKRQRTALMAAAGFIAFAILLLIYFGIFKK